MRKCGKQKMEKKTRKKKRKKHWGLGWGYRWRAAGRFPRRSSTCDRASCTGRVRRLPATRGGWSAVDTTRWTPYRQVLSSSTVSSCRPPFAPSAMASVIFEESMVSSSSVMVIPPPPQAMIWDPTRKKFTGNVVVRFWMRLNLDCFWIGNVPVDFHGDAVVVGGGTVEDERPVQRHHLSVAPIF